jgi:membrane protease YdiL (CAAX protease family)
MLTLGFVLGLLPDPSEAFGLSPVQRGKLRHLLGGNAFALVVGSAIAGVVEELLFRGLLQPRVGLLIATVAFTAMHALQYNAFVLCFVAAIGLVLAHLRRRWGTIASMAAHVGYNVAFSAAVLLG